MTNASINKDMLFANRLLRKMIEEWSLASNNTFISIYKTFAAKNLAKLFINRTQNGSLSEKEVELEFVGALSFKGIESFINSFLEYKISKIAAQDGKEAVD